MKFLVVLSAAVSCALAAPGSPCSPSQLPSPGVVAELWEVKMPTMVSFPTRLPSLGEELVDPSCVEDLLSKLTGSSLLVTAVMDNLLPVLVSELVARTFMRMMKTRWTLLCPVSTTTQNMMTGPSPMTSASLSLLTVLISQASSLMSLPYHHLEKSMMFALFLAGVPPVREAALAEFCRRLMFPLSLTMTAVTPMLQLCLRLNDLCWSPTGR